MRLVKFNCDVNIDVGKHGHGRSVGMAAGRTHVMATAPYNALVADNAELSGMIAGFGVWETRLAQFSAKPGGGGGKSVLFYTGAGGLGDQVMAWPVARWLDLNDYRVTVLADPGNDACWRDFRWVRQVITLPATLETVSQFDHHAIFELVTNLDTLPDQVHPTDSLLARLGQRGVKIGPILDQLNYQLPLGARSRRWSDRPYGLFHLAATNPLRSLPPEDTLGLARQLVAAAPDLDWIAVADQSNLPYLGLALPPGMRLAQAKSFGDLAWACLGAAVGVGPDSLLMHLCGTFNRPFVAYFGPIRPNLRTQHYRAVRAVYSQGACPLAPCHALSMTINLPGACPSRANNCCQVAQASAQHVAAQVKLALAR